MYVFSVIIRSEAKLVSQAGLVLMWTTIIFFITFLVFTATAIAIDWPPAWVRTLHLPEDKEEAHVSRVDDCQRTLRHWSTDYESSVLVDYASTTVQEPHVFCRAGLEFDPTNPKTNELFAEALLQSGKLEQSIVQFMRASDLGSDRASLILGKYFEGHREKDKKQSQNYLNRAISQGNFAAAVELGKQSELGTFDSPNYPEAARYYRLGTDKNIGEAYYRLGQLIENGLGIPADKTVARAMYRKAVDLNYDDALEALNALQGRND